MYKPDLAQTLALLVIAQEQQPGPELGNREAAIYYVIDKAHLISHLSEERKAELYAFTVDNPKLNGFLPDLQGAFSYGLEKVGA